LRDCLYMYLRVAVRACGIVLASALRLRHRCVTTARILCLAWMLEYLAARHSAAVSRACVCPCVRSCCVFECESNDGY